MLAGGTESMCLVPMGGHKIAPNPTLVADYPDVYLSTGLVAENHAREARISREEQDEFAFESHQKAVAAIDAGRFADETDHADHSGRRDVLGRRRSAARYVASGARGASAGVSCERHGDGRELFADQ